nr:hypothetical protein [uncultured Draconibacterium sp.]
MKVRLVLFAYLVVISAVSFGQETKDNSTSSDTIKKIVVLEAYLKDDSKPIEAFMNVEKDTRNLSVEIEVSLEKGRVRIEMYDPKGKKGKKDLVFDARHNSGNLIKLTPKKSTPESSPFIIGSLSIVQRKPKNGKWRIKLVPEKATGKVQISYSCSSK